MKTTVGLTVVVVLLVAGCSTTERVAVKEEPGICAFLGEACNELQPGAKGEAGLRWVNPKGDPTQYNKVMVNMAGFFGTDTGLVCSSMSLCAIPSLCSQTAKAEETIGKIRTYLPVDS